MTTRTPLTVHEARPVRRFAVRAAWLVMTACTCGASCNQPLRNPFRSAGPPPPEVLMAGASLQQIIDAVNQNSARVRTYQTDNASIAVPGMLGVPMLSGKIRAQRPGRLRLQGATSITGPEVDLGANDELFWFWIRRNEPPALYFARHDQFAGSAASQVVPIEPQWLLDALGFAEFKPTDVHDGPLVRGGGLVEIRSVVNARGGQLAKSTVVNAKTACIMEQHIYAPDGRILASAIVRSHKFYPEAGVALPQKIDVQMPSAELSLSIDVGTVQLNNLPESPQIWALPTLPGTPTVDLGAAPAGTAGSLGGQLGRADWTSPAPVSSVAELPEMSPSPGVSAYGVPSEPSAPVPAAGPVYSQLAPQTPLFTSPGAAGANLGNLPNYPAAAQSLPSGGVPATLPR
ncbi:MAG: hypothetical protein KF688_04985 [Pirellulales bacterium]|nr:hypothetical protein [Pirellulales bacterium]